MVSVFDPSGRGDGGARGGGLQCTPGGLRQKSCGFVELDDVSDSNPLLLNLTCDHDMGGV